jgi:hypothetical protein
VLAPPGSRGRVQRTKGRGYGNNFVLLVEDGTTLPSNLQGLYEVRYQGDELDNPSTMKLLKAFNDFKS